MTNVGGKCLHCLVKWIKLSQLVISHLQEYFQLLNDDYLAFFSQTFIHHPRILACGRLFQAKFALLVEPRAKF